jgi:ubiquinone/menaquinone biosynthesis C-methylase UbiE
MTTTTTPTSPTSASTRRATPLTRLSAAIYEPVLSLGERRGLRTHRCNLLAQARGLTVEIGGGTGLNLPHYPSSLDRLVLAEPDAAMRRRLQRRLDGLKRPASVIDAAAERLPFADGTVDTVVSTLVLCTVDSPHVALREIKRVLAPDGQLLFIEHVRASSRFHSRWQDRLAAPWQAFASGCHCNRPTLTLIAESGFEFDVTEATWRGMPSIVKPLVYGRARFVSGG